MKTTPDGSTSGSIDSNLKPQTLEDLKLDTIYKGLVVFTSYNRTVVDIGMTECCKPGKLTATRCIVVPRAAGPANIDYGSEVLIKITKIDLPNRSALGSIVTEPGVSEDTTHQLSSTFPPQELVVANELRDVADIQRGRTYLGQIVSIAAQGYFVDLGLEELILFPNGKSQRRSALLKRGSVPSTIQLHRKDFVLVQVQRIDMQTKRFFITFVGRDQEGE